MSIRSFTRSFAGLAFLLVFLLNVLALPARAQSDEASSPDVATSPDVKHPKLRISPKEPLKFGDVTVGVTSPPQTVTLINNSNSRAIPLTTIRIKLPFVNVGSDCKIGVPAGGTCFINIAFRPTVEGSVDLKKGLTITGAFKNTPLTYELKGTGEGGPIPTPTPSATPTGTPIPTPTPTITTATPTLTAATLTTTTTTAASRQHNRDRRRPPTRRPQPDHHCHRDGHADIDGHGDLNRNADGHSDHNHDRDGHADSVADRDWRHCDGNRHGNRDDNAYSTATATPTLTATATPTSYNCNCHRDLNQDRDRHSDRRQRLPLQQPPILRPQRSNRDRHRYCDAYGDRDGDFDRWRTHRNPDAGTEAGSILVAGGDTGGKLGGAINLATSTNSSNGRADLQHCHRHLPAGGQPQHQARIGRGSCAAQRTDADRWRTVVRDRDLRHEHGASSATRWGPRNCTTRPARPSRSRAPAAR